MVLVMQNQKRGVKIDPTLGLQGLSSPANNSRDNAPASVARMRKAIFYEYYNLDGILFNALVFTTSVITASTKLM